MTRAPAARLPRPVLALLLATLVAAPLVLGLPLGFIPGLSVDPAASEAAAAPPEITLLTPKEGEGVGPEVEVTGEARSAEREILDVHVRVGAGPWESVAEMARGAEATAFRARVALAPGDHVIEARAFDGETTSLVARALVRADLRAPPTLHVLSPRDGEGVESGTVAVHGTASGGQVREVRVEAADRVAVATLAPGQGGVAAWRAEILLPRGVHELTVRALGDTPPLPRTLRVAAADGRAAPTVDLLAPRDGAAFGTAGERACLPAPCALVAGTLAGANDGTTVRVLLDGRPAPGGGVATLTPGGAWSYRLPLQGLWSGEHLLEAAPHDAAGSAGVPDRVRLALRTPLDLRVAGDDAPAPTGTNLLFRLEGDHAPGASWELDGARVGEGATTQVRLDRPGHHVLVARTDADGATASASLPLYALNRLPHVALVAQPRPQGDMLLRALASDQDGDIVEYHWELGDNVTAVTDEPTLVHRYRIPGTYAVKVTAMDDFGGRATASLSIPVDNAAPVPHFTWEPLAPTMLDNVTLRDLSFDPEGQRLERLWRLPDGTETNVSSPTFRAPTRGENLVALVVRDADGLESVLTQTILVGNVDPQPALEVQPAEPVTGEEVVFLDRTVKPDGLIARREWDFGDGSAPAVGAAVAHAYDAPGTYTVRLKVTDDFGAVAEVTQDVVVQDARPDILQIRADPPTPRSHEAVELSFTAYDREGDVVAHEWEFGDGATSTDARPVHRFPRSGVYHVRLTVTDLAGQVANATLSLLVANVGPTVSVADVEGLFAAFPTTYRLEAADADGRIVLYRLDADGDGVDDCESLEPVCVFTYDAPGTYAARATVEDDEGARANVTRIVEVLPPPSRLAPPEVHVDAPVAGATLRGEVLLSGRATGVRPIERVEVQARNDTWAFSPSRGLWTLAEGNDSWRLLLDTRAFPDGPFDLVVRATDAEGGVGLARVPVTFDNGERESRVTLQLLDAPGVLRDRQDLRGSAYHPEGVTSVRWRIDEGPWRAIDGPPLAFVIALDREGLPPGAHVLQVDAYHGLTERTTLRVPFSVPGAAPALVVDEAPPATAFGLLRAAGRLHGEGKVLWRLDQEPWRELPADAHWRLEQPTAGIRGGDRFLSIKAVSPDGALESDTTTWKVRIVNPPSERAAAMRATPDLEAPPTPSTPADGPKPVPGAAALGTLAALALAANRRRSNP